MHRSLCLPLLACAFLVATNAGAADATSIRTFEKDGTIAFLVSDNMIEATPADIVLPAAAGVPHKCDQDYYPVIEERMHHTGTVMLSMNILPDGQVRNIAVAGPTRFPFLNDAALACVKKWAYVPARRNGQPVAAQHTVAIVWRLGEGRVE